MKLTPDDKREIKKWVLIISFGLLLWICLKNINHVAFSFKILLEHMLFPLLLGGTLAFIINIPMSALENFSFIQKIFKNKTLLRTISLVTTYISMIVIFALLIFTIAPQLVTSIQKIIDQAFVLVEELKQNDFINKYVDVSEYLDPNSIKKQILSTFQTGQILGTIFFGISEIFEGVFTTFIAFVFSIYLLASKETISKDLAQFMAIVFSPEFSGKACHVGRTIKTHFYNFFTGQFLVCSVLGLLCFIGMTVFNFPYPYVVSIIVWIFSLIPMVGPITGILLGTLIVFIDSPYKALLFFIFILVTKQLNDYITYPRVVGKAVGLRPMWILIAITLGGALMGVLGMVIFVPLFAIIYDLLILNNAKYNEKKEALELEEKSKIQAELESKNTNELTSEK